MEKILKAYQHFRSGIYFMESLPLLGINSLFLKRDRYKLKPEDLEYLRESVDKLFKIDVENIEKKIYPISVLAPKKPIEHLITLRKIYLDTLGVIYRRFNRKTKSFSKEAKSLIDGLPDYYQRNFHHQTDGYLSEESARIYDHQVELLFKGTSQAMRRIILPDMKEALKDIARPHILEVAVGTGSATEYLLQTFPNAKVTVLDLSPSYLKKAQENLKKHPKIDFVLGKAEDLPFKDQTFDAVFSVYLYHEIPMEVRMKVIEESLRVLKKDGFFGIVDSLQLGDDSKLNWALEEFPKDFHEPFYKNYIENKMEDIVPATSTQLVSKKIGFLTKALSYKKLS